MVLTVAAGQALADRVRIATFNTELSRNGPGLLLRDIVRGEDIQVLAVLQVIAETSPDILVLQGFDYDLENTALSTFNAALAEFGEPYPYVYASRPNTGMHTGLDLDGNGRSGEPRDAQGFGRFSGQGGMAVLSRHPIVLDQVEDYSSLLWRDVPDALLPISEDGAPFPSSEVLDVQRLSTTAHWVVPILLDGSDRIDLLTFHARPPVFDGPEDRNGKRNHDEIMFWLHYLDGRFGAVPNTRFVAIGDANNDPNAGEGLKPAITALLDDPRLQDPKPRSNGSRAASGDPFDTADWDDPEPGNLRVDYVLPSADWLVLDAGVHWPEGEAAALVETASRHRLVWVDLAY